MMLRLLARINENFRFPPRNWLRIGSYALLAVFSLSVNAVAADLTDAQIRKALSERKRDFDKYISARTQAEKNATAGAEQLRLARIRDTQKSAQIHDAYVSKMKRYSMQEEEVKDQAEEARVVERLAAVDRTREKFVTTRNHQAAIEASTPKVDTYQEFSIDMNVEPDSKVSHTGSNGDSGSGAGMLSP